MCVGRVRSSLACCLAVMLAAPAAAQDASAFVGDWKLVSFVQPDAAGSGQRDAWGPKPLGTTHHSSTGVMAAQLCDERRRPSSVPNLRDTAPAEARDAFVAMAVDFGTYASDTVTRTVMPTVLGAWTRTGLGVRLCAAIALSGGTAPSSA